MLRFGLSYRANTARTNSLYCVWHNHPLLFLSWVMKKVFLILGLIVLALLLPFFFTDVGRHEGADHNVGLPWQIEVDGTGSSQVFGVVLGRDRLGDMLSVLGAEPELAIIAAPGEAGSLEAYFSELRLGFVLAKVVLTLEATPEMLAAMAERAPKAEYMESSTRKIRLAPDDRALAESLPVQAISVIPTVNLDEATLIERFGAPGERLPVSAERVHLLYADRGLDIVVDAQGKELLQYVPPRDFARLREPLRQAESVPDATR